MRHSHRRRKQPQQRNKLSSTLLTFPFLLRLSRVLSGMTSLRELHLLFAGNLVGVDIGVDLSGAIGLESVERNLGALSTSRPELRFRVLSEVQTREMGVSLCLEPAYGFWSAATGLDCIDAAGELADMP
jgi:hypothetical protein